jgi:hypothetical protein
MLYLVKDDVGTQIKATLTREDTGSAVDLTNATVRMYFRKKGTTTVLSTLTSIALGDDLTNGIAIFAFGSGDLDVEEGKYQGEVEATFDSGSVESVFETIDFYVRADFT